MLEDFLLNLLASFAYDVLKALLPHPPSREAVLEELKNELRRQSEAFQAFQTVLTRFGAQAVVKVDGDVSGSVILLGNNNQVTVQDGGRLARGWLAWKGDPVEARRTYLEWLTARYARHIFPLSKLSFQVTMEQVYQPLMVAPYQGEWRPSLRFQARALPLDEAFASPSLYALTGLLGEGKSTALRYLAWVYAAQPEGHLLLGMGERLPFLTTVRHLYTAWQRTPEPLTAWAEAMAGEHPFLETALLRRLAGQRPCGAAFH
ncbi:MAG: hypothetical protein N2049_00375 [Anaerolineales bacterium]|nr:hypothetical protein [Anaerolineales bacterium]